ncbi:MAG: aldehyde dehydrogenase family protein [Bdellovibrionales bacterium]|nr:aldehyde dehydrogenase family protein [Bdellovibrionales bacterium]
MPFYSINPANKQLIAEWEADTQAEILDKIRTSHKHFTHWKTLSVHDRVLELLQVKKYLSEESDLLAELITQEMGKPIEQAKAEVEKCIQLIDYYAEVSEGVLKDEEVTDNAFVSKQPLGVLLGIMPWNFPVWQAMRFAVPSLISGNTILLKPAPNVIGVSTKLQSIFSDAGLESHFQLVHAEVDNIELIISHENVQGVSLTGSTRAGKSVAQLCGKYMKKSVFELGGSDPAIFLSDANLSIAVPKAVRSRLLNSGQSCIAAKRFLVSEDIYNDFIEKFISEFESYKVGDPKLSKNDIGPIAREDLLNNINQQKTNALKDGAKLLYESNKASDEGYYFSPTILSVTPDMKIFNEEVFGPMALVTTFKTESEMIELANKTPYGLGASIYTADINKAYELMKNHINSGSCFINKFVKSSPELPFGGVKDSGLGRELGTYGLLEFVNIKTIVM